MSPTAPRRPCLVQACPHAAVSRGRCATHARQADQARGTAQQRGYDVHWARIRAGYLRRHPQCQACGQPASDVHHLQRVREGGSHRDDNLAALCHRCHSAVTAREDSRWVKR